MFRLSVKSRLRWTPLILINLAIQFSIFTVDGRLRRPDEKSEAQSEVEIKIDIKVDQAGVATNHKTTRTKILTERARNKSAILRRTYNPALVKHEVVSVKSVFNGKVKTIPPADFTDLPIHNKLQGFDEIREIAIAVSQLEIGSIIIVEELIVSKPIVSGHFYYREFAGGWLGVDHWTLSIESEIPLHFNVNDTQKFISVKESKKSGKHVLVANTKRPVFHTVVDDGKWADNKKLSWIEVSTHREWAKLYSQFSTEWDKVITGPLPKALQQIIDSAKKLKTPESKMNYVLKHIREKINYVGDWRTVRGKYIPNDLMKIFKNGFGDCKDYSALTVRALRELGFQADPALVYSENNPREMHYQLPTLWFNHAVVRAQQKETVFWLDPTQSPTLSHVVPKGVDNRQAVWLRDPDPQLVFTSIPRPEESQLILGTELDVSDNQLRYGLRIVLYGREYLNLKKLQQAFTNKNELGLNVLSNIFDASRDRIMNFKVLKLKERLSDNPSIEIYMTYEYKNRLPVVGENNIVPVTNRWTRHIDFPTKDRVLYEPFPFPGIFQSQITIKGARIESEPPKNCKIDSPWIEAQRSIEVKDGTATIKDSIRHIATHLEPEEFNSKDYSEIHNRVLACFLRTALLVRPLTSSK